MGHEPRRSTARESGARKSGAREPRARESGAVVVIDASAVAALLFGEPDAESVAVRLEGRPLVAPTLLPYEVANTCRKKAERGEGGREELLAALALLSRLDIRYAEPDPLGVVGLAWASGLTAYDAAYLWLARSLEAELVTLDARLRAASDR